MSARKLYTVGKTEKGNLTAVTTKTQPTQQRSRIHIVRTAEFLKCRQDPLLFSVRVNVKFRNIAFIFKISARRKLII